MSGGQGAPARCQLALGLGNNVDYEIEWDGRVLQALAAQYGIREAELTTDAAVDSERSLVVSILAFLRSGAGGERFVASPAIIERFSARFSRKVTLGGTPIRAATAIAKMGFHSALHYVTMNEHVRRLTPPGCAYVCSSDEEHCYPHLIVQFRQGDEVQTGLLRATAPRANRIIYDNDPENIRMALNEDFGAFCPQAGAFLASGFNAMQDEILLRERAASLRRIMKRLPRRAVTYYEDGGFYLDELRAALREEIEDLIDIHGMNEEELQGYLGRGLNLLDPRQMSCALRDAYALLGARTLLVHTRHWVLAYGRGAGALAGALAGGIALAGARYRFGDDFTPAQVRDTQALPRQADAARFAAKLQALAGDALCCLPCVDAPEQNVTTIGLGDAFVGGFLAALCDLSAPGRYK